jgi:membrane fusion protein, multidrug efflux system
MRNAMDEDPKNYTPPPPGRYFVAGWLAAVALLVVATAGLVLARSIWMGRQTSELEREAALGPRVLVTHATRSGGTREIRLPASIHGYIETPIYAKVPGYLKKIDVDKGDRVRKGEVLAILESPETDQQVANARANYRLAKVTDDRNQTLLRKGVIAEQIADESHAAMLQNLAALKQMVAMQAYEVIRAPFDGMITARYVDPGALIPETTTQSTAATPIVAMATLSPLRVYAQMPQSLAPFVKDGDQAAITVTEYPDRTFEGSVTRHPDSLDPASRTMLVEVDLKNHDRALYPGMYATAAFTVAVPKGAPRVPDDALVFRNGKIYVPVVRQQRLHLAPVTLGYDNGMTVEVTHGIEDGEMIAVNVGQSARDGEEVQPVEKEPNKVQ